MGPMGPMPPTPQMGPPAPPAGTAGPDETMYQMRLAQIQQMPDGPEKDAAIAQLAADYQGRQSSAKMKHDFGQDMISQGQPGVTQTGGRFGTTVAASPLEHLAAGLRTYKGYKDVNQSQKDMDEMSKQKQAALEALLRAGAGG